jgi:hypothetical protein
MADAGEQKTQGTVSLTGPVERLDGELTLRIPLAAGGAVLAAAAGRIATSDDQFLIITIKPWLAEKFGISEGSLVDIDNIDGRFNIRTVATLRLSMDRLDDRHPSEPAPERLDLAVRLVAALVKSLARHLPDTFSVEGRDDSLQVLHDGGVIGGTVVGVLLEGLGTSPAHIASVALSALSDVQDAIAIELRTPWPADAHRQPMPSVREVEGHLYLWFGDHRSPVMIFDPIALAEVIGR